jgi:hypothetical protein
MQCTNAISSHAYFGAMKKAGRQVPLLDHCMCVLVSKYQTTFFSLLSSVYFLQSTFFHLILLAALLTTFRPFGARPLGLAT